MPVDFGDAPEPLYPTLLSSDGAQHGAGSLTLGSFVTAEFDGQPSDDASGDTGDDGIVLQPLRGGEATVFTVVVNGSSGSARLDAWIDWNGDGDWTDDGEQIASSLQVSEGETEVAVHVPELATSLTSTYARFRLSSNGGLSPTGYAADGEVEDYQIPLESGPRILYAGPAFEGLEAGVDPDDTGPIREVGLDAFASLEAAFAKLPVGGSVVYYDVGTSGNDAVTIQMLNGTAQYTVNGQVRTLPVGVAGLGFAGGAGDDRVTVNLAGGPLGEQLSHILFSGGSQSTDLGDGLTIAGSGIESVDYQPSAETYGDGLIQVDNFAVNFSGLEPVDFFNTATASLTLPGGDDIVTLTNGVDFLNGGTNQAIRATGTSGGVGFEAAAFWNITTLTINTTAVDGNDTITIASADNAHANANLVINTGTGSDSLNSNGLAVFSGSATISVNGPLSDGNGATNNFQTPTLNLTASGTVDLDIDVTTLTTNTSAGNAAQTLREVNSTTLTSLNAGSGSISLAAGTFNLGSGTSIADTSPLNVGGTLSLNGFSESVHSLAGNGTVNLGGNQLALLGGNASPVSFSGQLTGSGTLAKQGAGTQILAGNNTGFTGTTSVTGGTLQVTASATVNPLGTSNVVLNGGNLTVAGQLTAGGLLGRYYNITPPNINGNFPEVTQPAQIQSLLRSTTSAASAVSNVNFDNAGYGNAAPFASAGFTAVDNMVAVWSGKIDLPAGATNFNTRSDDGTMLFINGQLIVNNNFFQGATTRSGTFNAPTAGQYDIFVLMYEGAGGAGAQAWDGPAGTPGGFAAPIFASQPELALNNNVSVTGSSTITVTDTVGVTLGNLTHTVGTTLGSAGSGELRFAGQTTYTGSGTATYDVGTGGGDLVFSGQVNDAANNVTIVKQGGGQLILDNTTTGGTENDIDGPINVTAGQLAIIGTNGGSNPGDSATINLNTAGVSLVHRSKAGNPTFSNPINVNANANIASYMSPTGAVTNVISGAVAIAAGSTLTLQAIDSDQQVDGQITGSGNLAKQGLLNSVLNSNANNYTGLTEIQQGRLIVSQSNGLGATSGDTTVQNGAQLRLQNNAAIPAGETITIRGAGPGNEGAIRNESGNNSIADPVVLAVSSWITSNSGTLTLPGGVVLGGFGLTVDGGGTVTIPGVVAGGVTEGLQEGAIFNNAFDENSANPATAIVLGPDAGRESFGFGGPASTRWDGTSSRTWIYSGQFFDADGIFSFVENIDDNTLIRINGVQVLRNTTWNDPTSTGVLNFPPGWNNIEIRFGDGAGGAGAHNNGATNFSPTYGFGLNTSGSASEDGADYVFPLEPAGGGATLFRLIDGGITKQGSGTLRLENAGNTYAGATNVTNGRLQVTNNGSLGSTTTGTTVSGSGTLEFDGAFDFTAAEALTISGNGTGGIGAINSVNGNTTITTPITLQRSFTPAVTSNVTIGSGTAGSLLTLSGPITWLPRTSLTFTGAGETRVNSTLGTGAAPASINGFDERFFNTPFDANTIQNNVTAMLNLVPVVNKVLSGHLNFPNDAALDAEAGLPLAVAMSALWRTNFTPNESGVWQFQYAAIDDNASIWIDANQNGVFENIASERINASGCCGGSGVVSTIGLVAGQSYGLVIAMNDTAGGGGFADMEVKSPSGAFNDLNPSALSGLFTLPAPANSIVKSGTGTVTLAAANSYDGATTIQQGTLIAAHNSALGLTAGSTVVESGGTLGFANNVTITGEAITANGLGAAGRAGAIANISDTNSYTGVITAAVSSAGVIGVGSTSGTLTTNGTINLQFSRLELGGSGTSVINSAVGGIGVNSNSPGIQERIYNGVPADAQTNIEAYRTAPLGAADGTGILTSQLTYADDNAFSARATALGAVGFDSGDFSAVWTSTFTPNATGVWGFRFSSLDDNASIWVDYDQDGIFETAGDLGNERIYARGCCGASGDQLTTGLVATQSYLWGIAMSDTGGGGNFVNVEIRDPVGTWSALNPSALGTLFQVTTVADNRVVKTGTGTATLTGTNTYNGTTAVQQGTLVAASNAALGTGGAGTTVASGASLGFQGNLNYTTAEAVTIDGTGVAGGGAVRNISGNNTFAGEITAVTLAGGNVAMGSDAGTLTLNGNISLAFSSLAVVGSGNIVANGTIGGIGVPTFISSGGFVGQYYDLDAAPNNTSAAATLLNGTTLPLPLQALTPAVTRLTPRVDFGDQTETIPGDGSVLDRGGSNGNPFGGIGVTIDLDQVAAVWTGRIRVPENATYRFTTRSDDGTVLFIDGVRIVDNNFFQGMTNRSGDVVLTAGVHDILVAGYEGSGGSGFQATWEQLNGTTPFARRLIAPSDMGDNFNANNSLTKSGTGTLTLNGANTYNNGTIVNGGTVVANNTAGSATGPGAVAVNSTGTLSGNGTIAGVVTLNNGGTLTPGSGGLGDLAVITPVFNATGTYQAQLSSGGNGQLAVTGAVNLGSNVQLATAAIGGFIPALSQSFVIIQNDGADAVVGTFNGLAEGAQIATNFLGSGLRAFITYTGGTGNDVAIFMEGPFTFNGTAANEDFELRRVDAGGGISFLQLLSPIGGAAIDSRPYDSVTTYTLNAGDGNDNIFINHGGTGGLITIPVTVNGQSGAADTLRVGGGTSPTVAHVFQNDTDGLINLNGTLHPYMGIEAATDNMVATNRLFQFNGVGETIVLDDDPAAGVSRINSSLGVVTSFSNPSTLLTLSLTNGNDTLNIQGLDAAFSAGLTVLQDGGETVNFQTTPTNLGSGNLIVNANSIAFSQTVTTTGDASLNAMNGITTSGTGIDVAANNLNAHAGTGIDLDTTVATITTSNALSGNIQIDETNGLTLNTVLSPNGNVTINSAAGNLLVGGVTATTSTVTLTAPAGAIIDNVVGTNVTAVNLTASAQSGIDLDLAVASLSAVTTGTGAIIIDDIGGITLTNVVAANGLIFVLVTGSIVATNVVSTTDSDANDITLGVGITGDITVGVVAAGSGVSGDVALSAPGSIRDDNNDSTRITADLLTMITTDNIGSVLSGAQTEDLDTTANTISAQTTSNILATQGIWIDESNGVTLQSVATVLGVIRITTNGDTTATNVNAGGPGRDLTIINSTGSLFVDSLSAVSDRITLTTPLAIQEVGVGDAVIDLDAAQLVLTAGTGIGTGAGATLETAATALEASGGSGGLFLTNAGALTIGGLTAVNGVSVTGGGINLTTTAGLSITEPVLATVGGVMLNSTGGIDVNATVTASAGGVNLSATGGPLNVNQAIAASAAISLAATTGITVNGTVITTAGSIGLNATAGEINVNQLVSATGGGVTLAASSSVTTTAAVSAAGGDVTVNATSGITVGGPVNASGVVSLTATAGNVAVNQALTSTAGGISLSSSGTLITTAPLSAPAGGITTNATGIITVGGTMGAAGPINLTSTAGGIHVNQNVTATSGAIVLTANGNVITGAAINSTGGGVTINTVGGITVGGAIGSAGGAVNLTATSTINVNQSVTASGVGAGVTITATDAAGSGQDIVVLAGTTISSAAAGVTLSAGDNLSLPAGTTVAAATGIVINIDFGNADAGLGGTFTFAGDFDDLAAPVNAAIVSGAADTVGDTFNIRPDQDAGNLVPISVFGLAPFANPNGDSMTLDLAGLSDLELTLGGTNNGQWSFGTQAGAVAYNNIENVGGTGGTLHLVLDMRFSGFENGVADTIQVGLDAAGTSLQVEVNGVTQFNGPDATIASFTIIGSDDDETLRVVESAGGMPFFSTNAPPVDNSLTGGGVSNGGHLNSVSQGILTSQFPAQAPWDANDVTFHFDGGAGVDIYQVNYLTPHSVGYATDTIDGAGSGNIGSVRIGGSTADLLASFANIDAVTLDGAGGLLYADASLTPITSLQISNSGPTNDGVHLLTANGAFTPATFGDFNQVVVVGGTGSQTMEVVSTDSGGTVPLTSLQVSGDNSAGSDTAADILQVHSSTAGVVTTLTSGAGDDAIRIYSSTNSTEAILGQIVINAGSGTDTLTVDNSGSLVPRSISITELQIDGITSAAGAPDLAYTSVEILDVTGSGAADVLTTTLSAGSSLTTVNVRGGNGDDDFLLTTNDPVTGLTSLNLFGNDGLDDFGTPANPIVPSTTLPLNINGGSPSIVGLPTQDTIGDRLQLDMSETAGPVIVNTTGGVATSASHGNVNFVDIEDINLVDENIVAPIQMGDFYLRAGSANDFIVVSSLDHSNPGRVRLRFNSTFQDLQLSRSLVINSGDGNDYITHSNVTLPANYFGGGGDDYIAGGVGNDLIVGGLGSDTLIGGNGDNVIWGDNIGEESLDVGGNDSLSGGPGVDTLYGGGGSDRLGAFGNNDYAYGGAGDDTIIGGAGDDRLYGGTGNDSIGGDDGADILSGGAGNDTLVSNGGHDLVIGGAGSDRLNGGSDNDLMIANSLAGETSNTLGDTNDLALMALMANWGPTGSNRTGLAAISADGSIDNVYGEAGDDDISAEIFDLLHGFGSQGADQQF
ncbi:PA14 domain-containing protein [Anatilimnocola sp. NA78]|uniref:PA14 domain-containing protein n=1 Tax=Anatilimnocola sp. NA78 TaxID=3415683 RepID=UPI003CE5C66D